MFKITYIQDYTQYSGECTLYNWDIIIYRKQCEVICLPKKLMTIDKWKK